MDDMVGPTIPPTLTGAPTASETRPTPGRDGPLPEQFGRYRILQKLGQGAMGAVYLAHDTQLDRRVALKTPQLAPEEGTQVLERFRREARAAAGLAHPHLCPVYDVGEIDGTPYLSMAYVEGTPLADSARKEPGWPPAEAAALVRQIALALEEAHSHGVIHRDLKPSNIMINRRGEPVVMDFGLARRAGAADVRLTRTGTVMGTPAYMAPEQVEGDLDRVGPVSDVYALGVILYELLTGRLPFQGSMGKVMSQILTEEPVPPSRLRPGLDPRLEAVCRKAMAKRVEDRYASMAALAEALDGYLRAAPPADDQAARPPAPQKRPAARPRSPGRRGVWVAAAAAALVAAALGVVLYVQTDRGTVKIDLRDSDSVVSIDGEVIHIDKLGEPITLRVGEHVLTVQHAGMEADTRKFTVKRGKREVLTVELKPKELSRPFGAEGFRPLFNGKDLTGWTALNGRPAGWAARDGFVEVTPGKGDIMTEEKFGPDFKLHVEFWLPLMPNARGQARANSGVYLQGRYEVQILDSFRNDTYANGSVGALYGLITPDQGALQKAIRPPEQWQTYDITFHAPRVDEQGKVTEKGRITVVLNGVTVIDDGRFDKPTRGALHDKLGAPGPIRLQDHSGKVRFRNVQIKELPPGRTARPGT
jgi:hypothetical protein